MPPSRLYSRRALMWALVNAGVRNPKAIIFGLQKVTYQGRTLYVWPEVAE